MLRILSVIFCLFCGNLAAEKIIWTGDVHSNGNPTAPIVLKLDHKYQIRASGSINLGKWWQQGKPLASDACFDYADGIEPSKVDVLKNSANVPVCDGKYQISHTYLSPSFKAVQNLIHFWIMDRDYTDNSDSLKVEIIELD